MVIGKIRKPVNGASNKEKRKITKKELETIKHLEKTSEVVGNLNQNDIKAIRKLRKLEQEQEKDRE